MHYKSIHGVTVELHSDPATPLDWWVLKTLPLKTGGVFVDTNAGDGVTNNNTYTLERNFDWAGACMGHNPLLRGNRVTGLPMPVTAGAGYVWGKYVSLHCLMECYDSVDYLHLDVEDNLSVLADYFVRGGPILPTLITVPMDDFARIEAILMPLGYVGRIIIGNYACFENCT